MLGKRREPRRQAKLHVRIAGVDAGDARSFSWFRRATSAGKGLC